MNDSILPDSPQSKQCTKCKQVLPATTEHFVRRTGASDGFNSWCKVCLNTHKQAYRSTPEGKKQSQQYYIDNHDAIREQQRGSYAEHRDTSTAYFRRRAIKIQDGEKLCYGCEQVFLATPEFFSRNKNYADGLNPYCKVCAKEYNDQHRDERSQYSKQFREENKEKLKEQRDAHRDEKVEYDRQYYAKHNADIRERKKQHLQTEQGRMVHLAGEQNRHARKVNAQGKHTAHDITEQYKRQKGRCYYCKCRLGKQKREYHVDHIVPLSRGGSNGPDNLVIACPACNLSKHNKLLHEWAMGGRLL